MIPELNSFSKDCAQALQKEGVIKFTKPWGEQNLGEAPPTRILGLILPLIAWLGWVMHEKNGDIITWQKLQDAFEYGKKLSTEKAFE